MRRKKRRRILWNEARDEDGREGEIEEVGADCCSYYHMTAFHPGTLRNTGRREMIGN